MLRTLHQHINIRKTLTNNSTFSENINLRFTPDEVIVREIMLIPDDASISTGHITSTLLNSDGTSAILGTFASARDDSHHLFNATLSNPNSTYTLSNFINNIEYQFQVISAISGNPIVSDGTLYIHLEFIKYT